MLKAVFMQSETENFSVKLGLPVPLKHRSRSFELFEEYSGKDFAETIKDRKESYAKADSRTKMEIETRTDDEISNFQNWLESVKKLTPQTAHFYSISLKSLFIGLPTGPQIAQLFSSILENF